MSDVMAMWTVYDHPSDYPDKWVARKWLVDGSGTCPTDEVLIASSLENIRELLQILHPGVTRICRDGSDDPCIAEVWI
jgi:hypothetical protein